MQVSETTISPELEKLLHKPFQKKNKPSDRTLFNWTPQQTWLFIACSLLFTLIIYYLLHTRYVLYNGDDVWDNSRIYEYIKTGFNRDTIFTTIETKDKTIIFHILRNEVYGHFLTFFGWTKSNAHILSTSFIFLSALIWSFIIRALKFSFSLSIIFGLTMLLFPAYFGAADLTRPDAFTFFWVSTSFLLFIKKRYFFAAFTMLVGMETHAMGMMAGFYILAYVLSEWTYFFRDWKRLGKIALLFGAGIGVGIGYYLFLHWDILTWNRFSEILLNNKNIKKELPNYLITYFISPEWYLHVWELFLLLFTVGFYLQQKNYRKNTFVWVFLLTVIFSTFLTGRPNRFYIIYAFPAFQLMLLYSVEQANKLKTTTFFLGLVFMLNYGGLYWQNHSYDFAKITSQIQQSIPDKSIPVVGMSDNWFAAKEHPFHLIYNSIHDLPEKNLPELYLIETDYLHTAPVSLKLEQYILDKGWTKDPLMSKRRTHYNGMIEYFKTNYDCQLINKFKAYGTENAAIYYCKRK